MKPYLLLLLAIPSFAFGQFKNDNVLYKTIYWQDFCKKILAEKDALVLDVRSQGEYDDSSQSSGLNIGHLKGSTHINVTQLGSRIHEIEAYKNKPVYIYCSHSQRSRRSSRMLADSGFTNVININGGLSALYLSGKEDLPCKNNLLETANPYQQLNPMQVYRLLQTKQAISIIDVRSDSAFNCLSTSAKDRAMGKLKNAINIPFPEQSDKLYAIPKNKPVLLVDAFGNIAPKAALLMAANGYKNIMTTFNGLQEFLELPETERKMAATVLERNIAYELLNPQAFHLIASQPGVAILDVREADEFGNKAREYWRNRGHIKGATNIPLEGLVENYAKINTSKNQPLILYAFGSGSEAYQAASILQAKGFTKLYVLTGGIWGLRYKAYNYPGQEYLKDWVVDIPQENL